MRRSAEKARHGEQNDGPYEVALASKEIAKKAGQRNDDHAREQISGGHPRDVVQTRAEVAHHVRQRDVHDRAVDHLHHRGKHDGECDDVPMLRALPRHVFTGDGLEDGRRLLVGGKLDYPDSLADSVSHGSMPAGRLAHRILSSMQRRKTRRRRGPRRRELWCSNQFSLESVVLTTSAGQRLCSSSATAESMSLSSSISSSGTSAATGCQTIWVMSPEIVTRAATSASASARNSPPRFPSSISEASRRQPLIGPPRNHC